MMRKEVFLLLIIAALLLSYHLDKPFIGHHDWNGVFWGSMARDYIRGNFRYFPHYTPFLPILLSISGLLFGIHEWSLRLVTVCFSLLLLYFIYKIGDLLYERNAGLLAMILAMVTPMFLYFGKLPDHEPIVTSLITASFYFYLTLGKKNKKRAMLFLSVLMLALLESWASYFLILFLLIHSFLFEKKRFPTVLRGALIGVGVGIAHVVSILVFNGPEGFTNFLHAGVFRLNLDTSPKNFSQFTWPHFFVTEAHYAVIYFTKILLVLSGVWAIRLIWSFRRKIRVSDISLLVLFFTGASFLLVFSNLSYIHDYKLYVLLPFLSLASAVVVLSLFEVIQKRYAIAAYLVVALIVFGVATERLSYLRTLLATSFNTPGYKLGLLIHEKTMSGEQVFVNSTEFASFYEVFVTYYADRPVTFGDLTINQFQEQEKEYQKYHYLVMIKEKPADPALKQYLSETYELQTSGEFTFVDLQHQIRHFAATPVHVQNIHNDLF